MEKQQLAVTGLILVISAAVAATASPPAGTGKAEAEFFSGGEKVAELALEVADEPRERKTGLMNRQHLPRGHGMLFVFPREADRVFWMKDTYIPLDIIFIDANQTVVDIDHADPQPGTEESRLERYRSDEPAKYVIEANQGFTERQGIEAGDRIGLNLS